MESMIYLELIADKLAWCSASKVRSIIPEPYEGHLSFWTVNLMYCIILEVEYV